MKPNGFVPGKLDSYYNMSDATRLLKQFDSSLYYCDRGLKLAKENNHKAYQSAFLFNRGATLSDIGNYKESQHNLFKALPTLIEEKDAINTAISHYFIGRNYMHLDSMGKSIYHLKKMDSIFLRTNDLNPELRHGYEILVDYYKKGNDLANQLTYVKRMLVVDSIISKDYNYIDSKLVKEYSRIQLQEEQKKN